MKTGTIIVRKIHKTACSVPATLDVQMPGKVFPCAEI